MPNLNNSQEGSVMHRMETLYNSSKWYDIEFHIKTCNTGDTVVMGAHRVMLASCSPVFEALCFGPLAAKTPVAVTDIEPEAFQAMLRFLYTDKLELTSVDMVSSLYYAAKKYLLNSLLKLTCGYLTENINEKNCLEMYNFADIFQEEMLLNKAWTYICSHLNFAAKYANNDNLSPSLLEKLVKAPMLDVEEVVLVKLSQLWAEKTCSILGLDHTGNNYRNLLMQYDIFKNIRWCLLKNEDLVFVLPGLLTDEELNDLSNSEASTDLVRVKPPAKLFYIHRYVEKDLSTSAPRDRLTVSTVISANRSVTLQGFYVCCTRSKASLSDAASKYVEKLQMSIADSSGKIVVKDQEFKEEVLSGMPFLYSLKEPLPIWAGLNYDIRIHLLNSAHLYEFSFRNTCAKVPSGISVVFKEYSDVHQEGVFIPTPQVSLITGLKLSW